MTDHWHADAALLERYANGTVDRANAASVEAHLLECAMCRGGLAGAVEGDRLSATWGAIRHAIEAPRATLTARVLMRCGVREGTARIIAATPALTVSWLASVAIAAGWGLLASHVTGRGPWAFAMIAPLIPLMGIAVCYGPDVDPSHELIVASPYSGYRLFLLRALSVCTVSGVLLAAGAAFHPGVSAAASLWLLPALAVTTVAAALVRVMRPSRAVGITATAWILLLGVETLTQAGRIAPDRFTTFRAPGQTLFALLALSALTIVVRSARAVRLQENR